MLRRRFLPAWDDIFQARVGQESTDLYFASAVEMMEGDDGVVRFTLPLTPAHDALGFVYTRRGVGYWEMPVW